MNAGTFADGNTPPSQAASPIPYADDFIGRTMSADDFIERYVASVGVDDTSARTQDGVPRPMGPIETIALERRQEMGIATNETDNESDFDDMDEDELEEAFRSRLGLA